jgi:hypothetical protein
MQMAKRTPNKQTSVPVGFHASAENADAAWLRDELVFAWRHAQDDAVVAYREWCDEPGATAYATYRAVQDRADQAQDVLAARGRS